MSRSTNQLLPRSTPESEGIPSAAILDFIDALEIHDHPLDAVHSFMLVRHGKVVAEGWWEPYRPEFPHMLYSLSKSFTSSAIGIAVSEGLLTIDDPVLKFFPDDAPENPGEYLRAMQVKHLLSMNTGHHEDTVGAVWGDSDTNWPRAFLSQPVDHEPGTWFVYNTAATYMLSAIITQLTGEPLIDYLRPRLFEPLGIENPVWDTGPQGHSLGGSGLHITTDGIARFGQTYLQNGEWNGQQRLPAHWVAEASRAHSDNSNTQTNPDWVVGYGYQFWRCRHNAYRGDGAFGQYCIVMPEYDVVLAITSGVRDLQAVLDHVWAYLLPAFSATALPADPDVQSTLKAKLDSLSLPIVVGKQTSSVANTISGKTYSFDPNRFGIEEVRFTFDNDQPAITIVNSGIEQVITPGYDQWSAALSNVRVIQKETPWSSGVAGERMAANGAWTTDDIYELRICYTEGEVCPILRFDFSGDDLSLDVDPNVSWTEPVVTTLIGRVDS